jgi:hypothetical protein
MPENLYFSRSHRNNQPPASSFSVSTGDALLIARIWQRNPRRHGNEDRRANVDKFPFHSISAAYVRWRRARSTTRSYLPRRTMGEEEGRPMRVAGVEYRNVSYFLGKGFSDTGRFLRATCIGRYSSTWWYLVCNRKTSNIEIFELSTRLQPIYWAFNTEAAQPS